MCVGVGAGVVGVEGDRGWCVEGVEWVWSGLRGGGGWCGYGVERVWSDLRGWGARVGVCRGWSGCGRG